VASATCNANCTAARCGDGILNIASGEQCDTGAGPSITCNVNCTISRCGDGIVNVVAGELCDDGNPVNGDGCEASCTPTP
jgi:cysteine-rich repeat protein